MPKPDKLLSARDRHLVSRFSYGVTPSLAKRVRKQGGAEAWFEQQLHPQRIKDKKADKLASWFPSLRRGPADLWQRQSKGIEGGWEVMNDYQRWVLMRRMTSNQQLLEVMAEFWENHLHVPAVGDAQFTHRADYGRTIREHALGRFDDMLKAAITHPAMLIYLDAAESTKEHPNENLGRELLELHTVGEGHFTDKDVKNSARILTGYSVDYWESWRPLYLHDTHYRGRVKVKGFVDKNGKANGKATTGRYLRYLAHHPDTAERIAHRLAVKFVSDHPPRALVRRLARVYLAHDTAIIPVLRALIESPSFAGAPDKARDPGEDVVATYRALDIKVRRPTKSNYDGSALASLIWQTGSVGLSPFTWGRPDGQPIDDLSWSSAARMLASMRMHQSVANGWSSGAARYRKPEKWLPKAEVRFDDLVDHLAQRVLHRKSTKTLLRACSVATGIPRGELITKDHGLVQWGFGNLLTTLLDSPTHLSR